jgi:hypothetical protein
MSYWNEETTVCAKTVYSKQYVNTVAICADDDMQELDT